MHETEHSKPVHWDNPEGWEHMCTILYSCQYMTKPPQYCKEINFQLKKKKRIHLQCRKRRRHTFNPWVAKISWRRKWQPSPVFLPVKSHGQSRVVGYSPQGHKRVRHDWATEHTTTTTCIYHTTKMVRVSVHVIADKTICSIASSVYRTSLCFILFHRKH